ncbi:MAG TPA: ABC transporter permease, partial [Thermomicrobiales bacterium]|nr:ABC transporter permease [Thermomicrobiales bacterium]
MSVGATALKVGTLEIAESREASSRRTWLHLLLRNRIGTVGAIIVLLVIVAAIFAPLLAPYDPADQQAARLLRPSGEHVLGTDELGRDTLSRIIYGARVSLQVGIIAIAVSLLLGGLLGISAGFYGGIVDNVLMRFVDILFAFPGLILAIVITGLLGPSSRNAM